MATNAPDILAGALVLIAFWLTYQLAWRRSLTDRFRQELFHVRDSLFVSVAKGHGAFSDPAYGMLRMMLNSAIRSAYGFNLPHLILNLMFYRKLHSQDGRDSDVRHIAEKFTDCVDRMEEGVAKDVYAAAYRDMLFACARHMLRTWIPLVSIVFAVLLVAHPVKRLIRRSALTRRLAPHYVDGAVYHASDGGIGQPSAQVATN